MQSQKRQDELCSFPRQTIQYHSNPSLCPSNAEEAEVEQFYEDLQNLLELIPKKDVLFILGDSTYGYHQMVNTEIRLIIFFAAKMEKLYTVSKNKTRS